MLKAPETREYQAKVAHYALEAFGDAPFLQGPLEIHVHIDISTPPSWSKKKTQEALDGGLDHLSTPDTDNFLKTVKDALNELVWHDDRQVVCDFVDKAYAPMDGLRVQIWRAKKSSIRRFPGEESDKAPQGPSSP